MALEHPRSLSPSRISAFTECALAFRFSTIDHIPEPPTIPASRGTLVHKALELLFDLPPHERTQPAALAARTEAFDLLRDQPEFTGLGLDSTEEAVFLSEADQLLARYFDIEDPAQVDPIGLEMKLTTDIGGIELRGIIDRLERDENGGLVVTDYKTGHVPSVNHEQGRLDGVHFYALLCERHLGERPSRIQLLYLADAVVITAVPTDQSIRGHERKAQAVWTAIKRACDTDEFRPKPSRLCDWCSFKPWCPAFGGDPSRAAIDSGLVPEPDTTTA